MNTIKVFWKNKFGGRVVQISASDFDAAIHRRTEDGPWIDDPPIVAAAPPGLDVDYVSTEPAPEADAPITAEFEPPKPKRKR